VRREGLNSMMFRSQTATPCSGYVPRPGGEICLQCEQPDDCHVLKHDCQRCDTDSEMQFMRVACRVGSMGWDSHALMQLVHGVRHLGSYVVSGFTESTVASSQSSYRQHLQQHIFGAHPTHRDFVPCDICSSTSLALDSLPPIVRDEVQRLQQERHVEFAGLIGAVDSLIFHDDECFASIEASQQNAGAANAIVPPHATGWKSTEDATSLPAAFPNATKDALSPPAASSPKSFSSPLPFPLVQCTNVHVAAAILSLGTAYEACANIVIESGIDGRCINELLVSTDDAELNRFIDQDLGISSIMLRTKLRTLFSDMRATAVSSQLLSAIFDHSHEKMLWMKACLVLEACTKGSRPFVGLVFKRLHDRVIKDVQTDIQRNCGSCE
jgi:hypothetical protein